MAVPAALHRAATSSACSTSARPRCWTSAYSVLFLLLGLNIVLFIFNLLPVPPLDGWSVVKGIVPASVAYRMRELEIQYANIIPMLFLGFVIILFVSGGSFLGPLVERPRRPPPGPLTMGWWATKVRQAAGT